MSKATAPPIEPQPLPKIIFLSLNCENENKSKRPNDFDPNFFIGPKRLAQNFKLGKSVVLRGFDA